MLKAKTRHPIIIISLSILLVFTAILVFVDSTYAKYLNQQSGTASGTVASFKIEIGNLAVGEQNYSLTLQNISPTSPTQNYVFEITNGDNLESVSEVALRYNLTISTTGNLPVFIRLKDESNTELAMISQIIKTSSCETIYYLGANALESNEYRLSIEWDNNYTSPIFVGVLDEIVISASWEQVD